MIPPRGFSIRELLKGQKLAKDGCSAANMASHHQFKLMKFHPHALSVQLRHGQKEVVDWNNVRVIGLVKRHLGSVWAEHYRES